MSWGYVAVAAATVVGSVVSSNSSKKARKQAADAARRQEDFAREQWEDYKEIYRPVENQLVADAQNYDSAENYAKAASNASATVSDQFSKARQTLARAPGVDPSSAAYQSGMTNLGLSEAANAAIQQNAARQSVADTAYARKSNAVSLGKGLASSAQSGLNAAAQTSMGLAQMTNQNANQQAAAWGQVGAYVGKGLSDWYNKPSTPTTTPTTSTPTSTPETFSV